VTPWAAWMVAGLVLAALEMAAPGVFLLWVGLAALGTGLATAAAGLGWHAQLGLFVVLTAALVGLIALRRRRRPLQDSVNAPDAGLIGQTCRALSFRDREGRVSLGDTTWAARLSDDTVPQQGQALRVVGLDGTTLIVASAH
jgi:inner membrane protein